MSERQQGQDCCGSCQPLHFKPPQTPSSGCVHEGAYTLVNWAGKSPPKYRQHQPMGRSVNGRKGEAGGMAHWLRELAALPEDMSSGPSTHV